MSKVSGSGVSNALKNTKRQSKRRSRCLKPLLASVFAVPVVGALHTAMGADAYWDSDGANPGAAVATTAPGTWGSSLFWSSSSAGDVGTIAWSSGDVAIFSAGADATGNSSITLSGTQTAGGLNIEEGRVLFVGAGVAALGANVINISSGATLSITSNARITTTAGSIMNLNNSTIEDTNTGANGTFFDTDTQIVLGSGGGIFSYTTANTLNIVQTGQVISGTGSFTKVGVGVLALANTNNYTGATIVNAGELRMRTVTNVLPTATAVTVTSPGILNLNGVSTTIGSLTGSGDVGTGSGTLTISGTTSTTFNGALKNLANAGAGAVGSGNGRLIKSGSGVITFNGLNDINGSVTLLAGGITVNSGASLCGDIADLIVNGGTLTLNNTTEKVESFSSGVGQTAGTVVLGTGHTLTIDPVANLTYAGVITGAGGFTKINVLSGVTNRTLTLTGANNYDGATLLSGGTLSVGNATALGTTTGDTTVASGAEVLFTGAATNFTVNEEFNIAGIGSANNGAIAIAGSSTPTLAGAITLTGDATITVASTSTGTFTNTITSTANENLTLIGGSGAGGGGTISNVIDLNGGGITKNQGGNWTLSAANLYDGATAINAGTLTAASNDALGTATGGTTIASGGALRIQGNINYSTAEAVSVAGVGLGATTGAINNVSGDNTFAGAITMTADSTIGVTAGSLTLNAAIGGAFDLSKAGPGTLVITVPNTYNNTTVSAGTLALTAANVMPSAGNLTVSGPTTIVDLAANNQTVAAVQLTNGSITGTTGVLTATGYTVHAGSASAVLAGTGAALTKNTSGIVTLSAANTYDGGTTVSAGTLLVTNTSGSGTGPGAVNVLSGGTLGGTGSISGPVNVQSGGELEPGLSPGTLTLSTLDLDAGALLDYELGTSSDLTIVTTPSTGLTLDSGTNTITLNFTDSGGFAAGTFTLIDYDTAYSGSVGSIGIGFAPGGFTYSIVDNTTNTTIDLIASTIPNQWKDLDGSWGDASNWTSALVPDALDAIARFSLLATAPRTVTVDTAAKTAGVLTFNNTNKYTIAGPNAVHIDTTGGAGTIHVALGSHDVTAPLVLDKDVFVNIETGDPDDTLKVSDLTMTGQSITKIGSGNLEVNKMVGTGLTLSAGKVTVTSTATGPNVVDQVGSGATNSHLDSISITAATLDLKNNNLIVTANAGNHDAVRAAVEAYVLSGFGNFDWLGTGITSSLAAEQANVAAGTAVGVLDNFEWGHTDIEGDAVGEFDTIVKYTYNGDANLDGAVNNDDFGLFLLGINGANPQWFFGDFDYNGAVNNDDFNFFLAGLFTFQDAGNTPLSAELQANLAEFATANGIPLVLDPTPVPEPTGIAMLGIAGAGMLARRRRKA